MIVAAIKLLFHVSAEKASAKSLGQKIKDHLWSRFKVSVAEVGVVENPGLCQLQMGVSFVGNDEKIVRRTAGQITGDLREWSGADLLEEELEIMQFDDLQARREFEEKWDP